MSNRTNVTVDVEGAAARTQGYLLAYHLDRTQSFGIRCGALG